MEPLIIAKSSSTPKMFRSDGIIHTVKKRLSFAPKPTREEFPKFNTQISQTRSSIFALERRIDATQMNLLTICRCLHSLLPDHQLSADTCGIFDLPAAIRELEVQCSQLSLDQQGLEQQKTDKRNSMYPVQLVERPVEIPENERLIAPPRSLGALKVMAYGCTASGSFELLKVKEKELEGEVRRLEEKIKQMGGIYDSMISAPLSIRPSPPSASSSSSSQITLSDYETILRHQQPIANTPYPQRIPRKAVPVKDIVLRTIQGAKPFETTVSSDSKAMDSIQQLLGPLHVSMQRPTNPAKPPLRRPVNVLEVKGSSRIEKVGVAEARPRLLRARTSETLSGISVGEPFPIYV